MRRTPVPSSRSDACSKQPTMPRRALLHVTQISMHARRAAPALLADLTTCRDHVDDCAATSLYIGWQRHVRSSDVWRLDRGRKGTTPKVSSSPAHTGREAMEGRGDHGSAPTGGWLVSRIAISGQQCVGRQTKHQAATFDECAKKCERNGTVRPRKGRA